jgi:hypothetical protein
MNLNQCIHIFLKEKNISYTGFAFHSKNSQIKYTVKYLKKYKGPINKFKKLHEFSWNFLISRKACLTRYQNKKGWNKRDKI